MIRIDFGRRATMLVYRNPSLDAELAIAAFGVPVLISMNLDGSGLNRAVAMQFDEIYCIHLC